MISDILSKKLRKKRSNQHLRFNYGRIVVIDFRNAKTLPLRKCFTRLCEYFVYFPVSEVEMLRKVMFKCRFSRIQSTDFIEIVYLSCKCDFSKTHLQYDARILFQPAPVRYTVESRIPKSSDSVVKSESHRQTVIKNGNFLRYLQLSCKAISLAIFFRTQNFKSESRRPSWPKPSRNTWSKTAESGGMNGKYNNFKNDF